MKKMKLNIKLFSINLDNENDSEIDEYITFKNKPDTTTPINAANLNYVQRMIKRDIETVETNVTDIETSINNITGTILWENPNPTADFQAQTITLSSNDYDMLEILYRSNAVGGTYFGGNRKILKGYGTQLDWNSIASTNRWSRRITPVSDTVFSVGDSYLVTDGTMTNDQCVPLYIIGYKTGLFGGQS